MRVSRRHRQDNGRQESLRPSLRGSCELSKWLLEPPKPHRCASMAERSLTRSYFARQARVIPHDGRLFFLYIRTGEATRPGPSCGPQGEPQIQVTTLISGRLRGANSTHLDFGQHTIRVYRISWPKKREHISRLQLEPADCTQTRSTCCRGRRRVCSNNNNNLSISQEQHEPSGHRRA